MGMVRRVFTPAMAVRGGILIALVVEGTWETPEEGGEVEEEEEIGEALKLRGEEGWPLDLRLMVHLKNSASMILRRGYILAMEERGSSSAAQVTRSTGRALEVQEEAEGEGKLAMGHRRIDIIAQVAKEIGRALEVEVQEAGEAEDLHSMIDLEKVLADHRALSTEIPTPIPELLNAGNPRRGPERRKEVTVVAEVVGVPEVELVLSEAGALRANLVITYLVRMTEFRILD